jgi:hypothetical protein
LALLLAFREDFLDFFGGVLYPLVLGNLQVFIISPESVMSCMNPSLSMKLRVYSYFWVTEASTFSLMEKVHSYLLDVKMSIPVTIALAAPWIPVLALEKSMTLQG